MYNKENSMTIVMKIAGIGEMLDEWVTTKVSSAKTVHSS